MRPLISVIVPVHNGEHYIQKCIDSIEAQTYENLEVIIINDGSSDATEKHCQKLLVEYPNIQYFTLNDEGVSAARNLGLQKAKGEYITFVDADDRLVIGMIETIYNMLIEDDCDIVGCGYMPFSTPEEEHVLVKSQALSNPEIRVLSGKEYIEEELLHQNTRVWSKLFKAELARRHEFIKGLSIGEDMVYLLQVMKDANRVAVSNYRGYGYYQNSQGVMKRPFTPAYMDQIACWEKVREELTDIAPSKLPLVSARLMMGIMLVVGKIAGLSSGDRRAYKTLVDICHSKLSDELKMVREDSGYSEAIMMMDEGYSLKVKLFSRYPNLYLWLYHMKK